MQTLPLSSYHVSITMPTSLQSDHYFYSLSIRPNVVFVPTPIHFDHHSLLLSTSPIIILTHHSLSPFSSIDPSFHNTDNV